VNYLSVTPYTSVNDSWITSDQINATPARQDVQHPLLASENYPTLWVADFYKKIALDIVTETVFNYPYPYVSEKTLRPINCKRMFIILGPKGQLAYLKSLGIDTFGDLIDESYDEIADPETRFLHVVQEIKKFCALDLEQIKQYYVNNKTKFDHNFQVLKNLPQREIQNFLEKYNL
jgi:hypothetical protein